jgi:hypothetical protein
MSFGLEDTEFTGRQAIFLLQLIEQQIQIKLALFGQWYYFIDKVYLRPVQLFSSSLLLFLNQQFLFGVGVDLANVLF